MTLSKALSSRTKMSATLTAIFSSKVKQDEFTRRRTNFRCSASLYTSVTTGGAAQLSTHLCARVCVFIDPSIHDVNPAWATLAGHRQERRCPITGPTLSTARRAGSSPSLSPCVYVCARVCVYLLIYSYQTIALWHTGRAAHRQANNERKTAHWGQEEEQWHCGLCFSKVRRGHERPNHTNRHRCIGDKNTYRSWLSAEPCQGPACALCEKLAQALHAKRAK
jgi:hypothetical protein